MKPGSDSVAMTGLLQASTPMPKFTCDSRRPVQLPGEAGDTNIAWITSRTAKAHCFSIPSPREKTQVRTQPTKVLENPTPYQLQYKTAMKARAKCSLSFPGVPP